MGGISFFLFLVLTGTGVLLMFYYRPTVHDAYWDIKDLEYQVLRGDLEKSAPMERPLDGHNRMVPYVPRICNGFL